MNIIAGFQNNFSEGLYTKFKSYRYRVFVEYLGWELKCPNNEELDQFDKVDTAYVVAQDRESSLVVPDYYPPHNLIYWGNISTSQWNAYSLLTRNLGIIKVFSRRFFKSASTSQAVSSPSQLQFCKKQSTLQENKAQNNSLRLLLLE